MIRSGRSHRFVICMCETSNISNVPFIPLNIKIASFLAFDAIKNENLRRKCQEKHASA